MGANPCCKLQKKTRIQVMDTFIKNINMTLNFDIEKEANKRVLIVPVVE